MTERAKINYKTTEYFDKNNEKGIKWDDPDIAIQWKVKKPILSNRDKIFPYLRNIPKEDIPNLYNIKKNKYIEPSIIKIPYFPASKASLSFYEPEIFGKKKYKKNFLCHW